MRKLFIALLLCVVAVVLAQKKYYSLKDAQYLLTNENGEVCLIFPDNNRNNIPSYIWSDYKSGKSCINAGIATISVGALSAIVGGVIYH